MTQLQQLSQMIHADEWMMECLAEVEKLGLDDWYIAAGFVRNKVWDQLHEYKQRTPLNDVDVVFFDRDHTAKSDEQAYIQQLSTQMPGINWSVINLARIHLKYAQPPFENSIHAISYWPELPTCVGVRLSANKLEFAAPWGISHNFSLQVNPNKNVGLSPQVYQGRIGKKQWHKLWPKLTINPYS